MKKALIVTTVSGFLFQFEKENVKILQSLGYEIHYASNFSNPVYGKDNKPLESMNIVKHQIDFVRSPYDIVKNVHAYRQLEKLLSEIDFNIIHCHTPMGGVLTRLAAHNQSKKRNKTTFKMIYTAHGFHFYSGAPIINWMCYYSIERLLAHYTDVLITINSEDYERAKKFKLHNHGKVFLIHGVGIDIDKYKVTNINQLEKRRELGISPNDFVFLSIGELSKRKNHQLVIKACRSLSNNNFKYLICGEGSEKNKLEMLIDKENLNDNIMLVGYRNDIPELLSISDCFIFPSLQEGLSVAMMEAKAAGLPIICTPIRGNTDLYEDGIEYAKTINEFSDKMQVKMNGLVKHKYSYSMNIYDKRSISEKMKEIYVNIE